MSAVRKNNSFSRDRIAAGLSLGDIERELGVSSKEVKAWESGAEPAPHRIINALDIMIQCKAAESAKAISNPAHVIACLLYTSPSPRDKRQSRMPSSA